MIRTISLVRHMFSRELAVTQKIVGESIACDGRGTQGGLNGSKAQKIVGEPSVRVSVAGAHRRIPMGRNRVGLVDTSSGSTGASLGLSPSARGGRSAIAKASLSPIARGVRSVPHVRAYRSN